MTLATACSTVLAQKLQTGTEITQVNKAEQVRKMIQNRQKWKDLEIRLKQE